MKRITCLVKDEAKEVLMKHKAEKAFARQDDALEDILLKFGGVIS